MFKKVMILGCLAAVIGCQDGSDTTSTVQAFDSKEIISGSAETPPRGTMPYEAWLSATKLEAVGNALKECKTKFVSCAYQNMNLTEYKTDLSGLIEHAIYEARFIALDAAMKKLPSESWSVPGESESGDPETSTVETDSSRYSALKVGVSNCTSGGAEFSVIDELPSVTGTDTSYVAAMEIECVSFRTEQPSGAQ